MGTSSETCRSIKIFRGFALGQACAQTPEEPVSDGSSTSPHLRYAETTDEGGRGIFLVAQLADRWGTRYTGNGKVIWSEQPLPDGYGA